MHDRSSFAIGVLLAGVVLGILADLLLRVTPWGLNVALWTAALLAAIAWLGFRRLPGTAIPLFVLALLFILGFLWRDSPVLYFLNGLAAFSSLALAMWVADGHVLRRTGFRDFLRAAGRTSADALAGTACLARSDIAWREVNWKELSGLAERTPLRSFGIGFAISIPLLLAFGGLLASADRMMGQWLKETLSFGLENIRSLMGHSLVAALYAWLSAGYIRGLLLRPKPTDSLPPPERRGPSLGAIEAGMPLALLDLLFLAFVLLQFRYLFGASNTVELTPGLTYSEYARHGFFQLLAVVALVLPVLLTVHRHLREDSRATQAVFRVLAGVQIPLVALIAASALWRMALYEEAYGLTPKRFYATAIMLWLAVLLLWFALSVLPGRRDRFGFDVFATGLVAILLLNAVNPDAVIADRNLGRARHGHTLDTVPIAHLSADAVPVVLAAMPRLDAAQRITLRTQLLARWILPGNPAAVDLYERDTAFTHAPDWRTWNWSRSRARAAWLASEGPFR